jgi:hypothetical protein
MQIIGRKTGFDQALPCFCFEVTNRRPWRNFSHAIVFLLQDFDLVRNMETS